MKDWYIDGIKEIYSLIMLLPCILITLIIFILLYPFLFTSTVQDISTYIVHKLDKIYNMF